MVLKDITLKKGMTKEEVNELVENYIFLEDERYEGMKHKHNWKCKCGKSFKKTFNSIKFKNAIRCDECKYREQEKRYKYEVEKSGEYEYIRSFRKGDTLPNGNRVKGSSYIQIKHKYCGRIYEVLFSSILKNHDCDKCCGSYENSFAYYIKKRIRRAFRKILGF